MRPQLALITGASSGIGMALAKRLAKEGITLILNGRDKGSLEQLARTLPTQCQSIVADLTKKEERQIVIDAIRRQKPDLVVNNAGMGIYGSGISNSVEKQQQLIDLNVSALQELTLIAAAVMKENKIKGTILNVSSVAGFQVMPYLATYSATKAYVTEFSQCLDFELKKDNIRVLTSCPGVVATKFRVRAGGSPKSKKQPMTMTAEYAAEQIWCQIQKGKRVHTFDWRYRLLVFIGRYLLPTAASAKIGELMMRSIAK